MKIALIVGTRPEVIKMSPIIRACQRNSIPFFIVHSNQHYSASMDEIFFKELDLPSPQYNLHVGAGKHGNQTGNILIKLEPILEKEQPTVLLTQGDTNTVLASSLTAVKLGIKIGHVEAGLRSYDKTMPEETNRIVTDHLSTYLFAVSDAQCSILHKEGISSEKIYKVGNTIVDALMANIDAADRMSKILEKNNLSPKNYFLITAHRSSNVDSKPALKELMELFARVIKEYGTQMVWPMHPRTTKTLKEYGVEVPQGITLLEPLGYFDFLKLQKNAKLVLTDSGGIQEEACILKVPCVTLRENTERPETVDVGASILVGRSSNLAVSAIGTLLGRNSNWKNPFGDGTSAEQIINIVKEN